MVALERERVRLRLTHPSPPKGVRAANSPSLSLTRVSRPLAGGALRVLIKEQFLCISTGEVRFREGRSLHTVGHAIYSPLF